MGKRKAVLKPPFIYSYLLLIAACAAANLAIGTLNGEHDTYVNPTL